MTLTLEQYAGPYLAHPDFTPARRANALHLIECVNAMIAMAEADGIEFETNPHTGCLISGDGNGGFRPQSCRIGARDSAHKQGQGIDIKEVTGRSFARWCLVNADRLKAAGICAIENPRWTRTWVHLQTRAVPSGNFAFIPSSDPPLAPPLPEQA